MSRMIYIDEHKAIIEAIVGMIARHGLAYHEAGYVLEQVQDRIGGLALTAPTEGRFTGVLDVVLAEIRKGRRG